MSDVAKWVLSGLVAVSLASFPIAEQAGSGAGHSRVAPVRTGTSPGIAPVTAKISWLEPPATVHLAGSDAGYMEGRVPLQFQSTAASPDPPVVAFIYRDRAGDSRRATVLWQPMPAPLAAGMNEASLVIRIKKSRLPVTGRLFISVAPDMSDASAASLPLTLVPPPPPLAWHIPAVALGLALLSVLAGLLLVKGVRARAPMGIASWDFKTSWATNLTLVGALLTGFLTFAYLPEQQTALLTKPQLHALNLIVTTLVAAAPLLYNLVRTTDSSEAATPPVPQGAVWSFALACVLTLWGVIGQLGLLLVILAELVHAQLLAAATGWMFTLLLLLLLGAVLVYGALSIRAAIPAPKPGIRPEELKREATPARQWSIL